ncbi:MAG: hypothetical protein ACYSU0_13185 [Planctomycetota bacterium]|jgi:hypothetical protein
MHSRAALWIVLIPAIAWGGSAGARGPARGSKPAVEGPKLTREQAKQLRTLLEGFRQAEDQAGRKALFDEMIGLVPSAVTIVKPVIDRNLNEAEQKYIKILAPKIRAAYLKRLSELTDEQVLLVQGTRRFWKDYLLNGGGREDFRKVYLKPIWDMAAFLLLKVGDIDDEEIAAQRKLLEEFAGYRSECHRILKVDPDPTVGKVSPTGIAYAPLDQPPTFRDNLHHLERTLVLAHSVASEGARRVLMMNDAAAREIDVQEAEFTMFCNEVRMLAGTVAWRVEPLGCAVTRDHSNDRKEGKASGHMSTVPGKHGFGDRNRRMGAPFYNSEGAGGGRNGRGYANGLSYGGGHTGPLYSLRRNCVGVGRRKGAFTSQYRFDKSIIHPCPATENELWIPPGVGPRDIRSASVLNVYRALKVGAYGTAQKLIERVKPRPPAQPGGSPTGAPRADIDAVLLRFFRNAVDMETDWFLECVGAIERAGDVYEVKVRLADGLRRFRGIGRVEEKASEISQRLAGEEMVDQVRAGRVFHWLARSGYKESQLRQLLPQFLKRYEGTAYAEALKLAVTDEEKKGQWFAYFLDKNPELRKYEYPPKLDGRKR